MVSSLLNEVEGTLKEAHFKVSFRCDAKQSCFDIATRRDDVVILVRALNNLGGISEKLGQELRLVSKFLRAKPLIVSYRTAKRTMDDDAIYIRHDIPAVTPQTLEDAIARDRHPLVEARPGGFYVRLDGEAIREKRLELGLSLGELASMAKVSKRTIYGYEMGLAKASVEVAIRLESILGIPIVMQISLFNDVRGEMEQSIKEEIEDEFARLTLRTFRRLGLQAAKTNQAPFDFVASMEHRESIIGKILRNEEEESKKETRIATSVANVTKSRLLFIAEEKTPRQKVKAINCEDFEKIRNLEQLYSFLC